MPEEKQVAMIRSQPDLVLEKKLNRIAWLVAAVVLLLVFFMRKLHISSSIDFSFLPPVYSTLNAITAAILLAGLYFIKTRQPEKHRQAMSLALLTSLLFLLGYLIYHFTTPDTKFGGEGNLRYVYFFLLITHVVLAAVILPFILFTFIRAYTGQFDRHRRMARWVYWLWLYVAITGPVIYLLLKPYYR